MRLYRHATTESLQTTDKLKFENHDFSAKSKLILYKKNIVQIQCTLVLTMTCTGKEIAKYNLANFNSVKQLVLVLN